MSKLLNAWFNDDTQEFFLPELRMVYPKFLKPDINKQYPNNDPKFSGLGLIPKAANIDVVREAVIKLATSLYGANWKDKDPAVKMPIKKTVSNDKLAEYADEFPYFVSVGSTQDYPPAVFGADAKPFTGEQSDVYGGRWAIYTVDVWGPKPEKKDVNRFISLGIKRVQLRKHGERIGTGGGIRTNAGFEAADVGSAPSGSGKPASTDDIF
jgi:hypothetical protein